MDTEGPPGSTRGVDELSLRIVTAAMALAERDGFDAVRLRDLAVDADVALGTVYRRFSSKEDILAAALEFESEKLEEHLRVNPITDANPDDRVRHFFRLATKELVSRPKLASAMLRTIACGEPDLAQKVTRYQGRITSMIVDAQRGPAHLADEVHPDQVILAHLLQQIWFGALVGWTSGLIEPALIDAQMERAVSIITKGLAADVQDTSGRLP